MAENWSRSADSCQRGIPSSPSDLAGRGDLRAGAAEERAGGGARESSAPPGCRRAGREGARGQYQNATAG